jgi:hypothetical protein
LHSRLAKKLCIFAARQTGVNIAAAHVLTASKKYRGNKCDDRNAKSAGKNIQHTKRSVSY